MRPTAQASASPTLPDPITNGPFVGSRNPFPMFGVPDVEVTGSIR